MQKKNIVMKSVEMRIIPKGDKMIYGWDSSKIIFKASSGTVDKASNLVQLEAYKNGWTRDNCSAYARATKPYYKYILIGRIIQLW